jgi:hypothetical protein
MKFCLLGAGVPVRNGVKAAAHGGKWSIVSTPRQD